MTASRLMRTLPVAALLTAGLAAPGAVAGTVAGGVSEPSVSPAGLDPATLSGELRASGFTVNPGYPMLYGGTAA